jgi:hypothetical protein
VYVCVRVYVYRCQIHIANCVCVCARVYIYIPSFSAQIALDEGSLPLLFGILLFVWTAGARECVSTKPARAAMLSEKSVSVSAGAHDRFGTQSLLRGTRGHMRTCPRGLEQAPLLGCRFARPPHTTSQLHLVAVDLCVTCAELFVRGQREVFRNEEGVHMNAWHGAFLPPPVRSVTAC